MHQVVHNALKDSGLTEARQRTVRKRFASDFNPYRDVGALGAAVKALQAEQAAAEADPRTPLRRTLDDAYYGTRGPVADRGDGARHGHAKDGWRDGYSHPFKATWKGGELSGLERLVVVMALGAVPAAGAGVTFDKLTPILDENGRALPPTTHMEYRALCRFIEAGIITA